MFLIACTVYIQIDYFPFPDNFLVRTKILKNKKLIQSSELMSIVKEKSSNLTRGVLRKKSAVNYLKRDPSRVPDTEFRNHRI